MLPFGPGKIAAMSIARWKTKGNTTLDAVISTVYTFEEKDTLNLAQVRRFDATPKLENNSFSCTYKSVVKGLPDEIANECGMR
jgi:hypothetical protein